MADAERILWVHQNERREVSTTKSDKDLRALDHIVRLVNEYVEATECKCKKGVACWHCVFRYNLECDELKTKGKENE